MMRSLTTWLAAILLSFAAAIAHAGVGLAELPGLDGDGPVTVYYPSSTLDQPLQRGPFTLNLAWQGTPVRGNGRLVVISHGSGGSPWVHTDLARALVEAGFVVALPEHRGDNHKDYAKPGPDSWKLRPAEVSRAIDAMAQDRQFAPLLSLDKVGMYGMSAGGHTALSLAGGRWSPARYGEHCQENIPDDFSSCVGMLTRLNGGWLDGLKKSIAAGAIRMIYSDTRWYAHSEPRIQAVVAGVPSAADFDMASLAVPRVPLGLITAGNDRWLNPRFHSDAVIAVCKTCERLAEMPTAGHAALLSPPPPVGDLGSIAAHLLGDPPGFDRGVLPQVYGGIVAFFTKHLLP